MRTLEKTAGVPMACQHRLKETSSLNAWLLQIHGRDKDWPDFILLDQYLGADATVPLLDAFWKTLEYSASLRLGFCPVFLLSATGVSATADNPLPPAWVWGVFQKPLPDSEILTSLRPYWDRTWQHQAQQQRLSNLRGTTGIQDEAALRRFMMKMAHKLGDLRLQVYHALKAIQQDGPDVTEPWGRLKHGLHEMKGTVGLGGVGGTLYAFLSEWENALQVERSFRAGRGAVLRERQPECESEPMTFCVQTFWQDLNRHLGPYCLNLAKQGL